MKKRKNIKQFDLDGLKSKLNTTPESTSLLERSKYTLDLVNTWINVADTKVSIMCAVSSVVIAVVVFVGDIILKQINTPVNLTSNQFMWFVLCAFGTALSFILSLIFYLLAIFPSLISGKGKNDEEKNETNNTRQNNVTFSIFYNDISKFVDSTAYINAARKINENEFVDEVLKEVYLNSKICSTKMIRFKIGVILSVVSFILCILSSVLLLFAHFF